MSKTIILRRDERGCPDREDGRPEVPKDLLDAAAPLHHLPGKLVGQQPGLLFTDDKISPGLLCSLSRPSHHQHHQLYFQVSSIARLEIVTKEITKLNIKVKFEFELIKIKDLGKLST